MLLSFVLQAYFDNFCVYVLFSIKLEDELLVVKMGNRNIGLEHSSSV